jgi:hypothetical protein
LVALWRYSAIEVEGYVCVWTGSEFVGGPFNVQPVPSGECQPLDHGYSAYNNSRRAARFWEHAYEKPDGGWRCEGRQRLLAYGASISDMGFDAQGLGGY